MIKIGKKVSSLGILIFFIILSTSLISAVSYSYNQKISIKDNGEEIGYVKPYQKNILEVDYAYLEWQRYGFPIGYSFPIALVKGTTTSLPFGIEGELLRVKIGKITSSSIELIIDQSDIATELNNLDETLPENIEAITEDIEAKTKPIIDDINLRIEKAIDRNYHSSLHIIDVSNSKLREMSQKIKDKESELAEEIADSVIYSVLNAFVAPGSGIGYQIFISQIPSQIRHDITTFLYNIEYIQDSGSESSFADKGIATLYIGNPSENKISSQFNNQLKNSGLPYFEENKIVGKRNYSSSDIGIISAIPEEKYWDENTLQNRWNADRIRLYKTQIAGIGNEGLETTVLWYNDQLELAKDSISGAVRLAGGAADEAEVELNEILSEVKRNVDANPKSAIGFATIAQGWILTGVSSLQEPDFEKVDSLGYVVIVKKQGNSYKILETHSIIGDKVQIFLGDYQEAVNEIADTTENTQEQIKENTDLNRITGKVIEDSLNRQEEDNKDIEGENPIINFFKKIWGWIFG